LLPSPLKVPSRVFSERAFTAVPVCPSDTLTRRPTEKDLLPSWQKVRTTPSEQATLTWVSTPAVPACCWADWTTP